MTPATCVPGMGTSAYFKKAIYQDQSPAAAEYFDARIASIFVPEASQSLLEGYSSHSRQSVQPPSPIRRHEQKDRSSSVVSNRGGGLSPDQSGVDVQSPDGSAINSPEWDVGKSYAGLHLQQLRHEAHVQEFLRSQRDSVKASFCLLCVGIDVPV
jgi:hypothetical protein